MFVCFALYPLLCSVLGLHSLRKPVDIAVALGMQKAIAYNKGMVFPKSFLPEDHALLFRFRAELSAGAHLFDRNLTLLFRDPRQRKVSPNKSPFPIKRLLQLKLRAHRETHREFSLRPHFFRALAKQLAVTAGNMMPLLLRRYGKEGIGFTERVKEAAEIARLTVQIAPKYSAVRAQGIKVCLRKIRNITPHKFQRFRPCIGIFRGQTAQYFLLRAEAPPFLRETISRFQQML